MTASKPRIVITYCTQCQWLMRAAWLAQEILSTFGTDLGEVALMPGTGGIFLLTYNEETIWERNADGGFPDARTIKQRVRDRLDPGRDLGHIDRPARPGPARVVRHFGLWGVAPSTSETD
ncbi:MAG: SelT/SelW/SelH family protein [Xanthobacteraceae bacterium]